MLEDIKNPCLIATANENGMPAKKKESNLVLKTYSLNVKLKNKSIIY